MLEVISNKPQILNESKNNLITRNRFTALFLTHVTFCLYLITFGMISKNKYVKYISNDGKTKYVATKHLVEHIFEKTLGNKQLTKKIRTDVKIQKISLQILDVFKTGIIKDTNIRDFLSDIKNIKLVQNPSLNNITEIKKIVCSELEKLSSLKSKQFTKEFPIYWKDYFQFNQNDRNLYKNKFESLYGAELSKSLFSTELSLLSSTTKNLLEDVYNKEMDKFEDSLQSGDVIFFKLDKSKYSFKSLFNKSERIDYAILKGQKLAKNWLQGPAENASHSFIHVAIIYKEKGKRAKLVEATPGAYGDDIRSSELRSIAGRLPPGSKVQYRISRIKDSFLSENVAKIAFESSNFVEYDDLCKPVFIHPRTSSNNLVNSPTLQRTDLSYSKKNATKSIFTNTKLSQSSIQNLFESYAYYQKEKNIHKAKNNGLFCSYFTSFSIQFAEASENILKIIQNNNYLFDFNKLSKEEIKSWAMGMAKKHGHELNLTIKNNAENISPQKLRSIFHKNFNNFSDVLEIIPPTA